jgi:hypothetical protein
VIGTFVNTGAVVVGSLLGVVIGKRLPDRIKTIVMQALGLSVILIGLQMALSGTRPLFVIGSLLLGAITGELLDIEGRIAAMGEWLKRRFRSESPTFVQGFVTASVLYCTGAMVIVGAIRDGTVGDPSILYIRGCLFRPVGIRDPGVDYPAGLKARLPSGSRGHRGRHRHGRPSHPGDRHQYPRDQTDPCGQSRSRTRLCDPGDTVRLAAARQ